MIFHDKDRKTYDYKVTYHHKQKGPYTTGWVKGREDAYVYCYMPKDINEKKSARLY